jgi:hypothetical protein
MGLWGWICYRGVGIFLDYLFSGDAGTLETVIPPSPLRRGGQTEGGQADGDGFWGGRSGGGFFGRLVGGCFFAAFEPDAGAAAGGGDAAEEEGAGFGDGCTEGETHC